MENAWLDSLSEDWVSQPRSAGSPVGSLPSIPSSARAAGSSSRGPSSRLPLYNPRKQSKQEDHSSSLPLSERSASDINVPVSQRGLRRPSKLRNDISKSLRSRRLSRTTSASSAESVQHHTIQHKSLSASLQKSGLFQDTPEWKRRLLHGDVAYGDQRDLFSGVGLENIFRPPAPDTSAFSRSPERSILVEDAMMPSSPPPYDRRPQPVANRSSSTAVQNDSQPQARKEQKAIKYKLADTSGDQFSEDDLSQGSSFRPNLSTSTKLSLDLLRRSSSNAGSVDLHGRLADDQEDLLPLASGQSDDHHEILSSIYISRHNTAEGKVDYLPGDASIPELQQNLEDLGTNLHNSFQQVEEASQELPGDATSNTEDFAHNGRFINLQRGGDSEDDSFRRRMLSPSSLPPIDESAMLQEESIEASTPKLVPDIRKAEPSHESLADRKVVAVNATPRTPSSSPKKDSEILQKKPSVSPLKLFGVYDTFTNQTLLRRLSQFEGDHPIEQENSKGNVSVVDQTGLTQMNDAYIAPSSPSKVNGGPPNSLFGRNSTQFSNFGNGNLDTFQFREDLSINLEYQDGEWADTGFSSFVQEPAPPNPFKFHLKPLESQNDAMQQQKPSSRNIRQSESSEHDEQCLSEHSPESAVGESLRLRGHLSTPRKSNGDEKGKRLPISPLKDPTPKRRRTLHETDISHAEFTEQVIDSVRETHHQMQSILGKKRKDAKHENDFQSADPQLMSSRQIIRPRTTSMQNDSSVYNYPDPAISHIQPSNHVDYLQRERIARVQAELDAENSPRALDMSRQSTADQNRKPSVTTQDFLDEAKKIMAGIRGKARPRTGLASVEESESDTERQEADSNVDSQSVHEQSLNESTREPFSRPPSRVGGGALPRIPRNQQDPEVLSYLRKYEELSEFDDLIASSMKSTGPAKDGLNTVNRLNSHGNEGISRRAVRSLNPDMAFESDPPNAQITEYPELQRKRKISTASVPSGNCQLPEVDYNSLGSNASSGVSTGKSIPTGSSRGSESRRVIAPHTVSHLIPEELAGMVFDRERHVWVKGKGSGMEKKEISLLPSDGTEDDPFEDIPDLSVDLTMEMQRIREVATQRAEQARDSEAQEIRKDLFDEVSEEQSKKAEPVPAKVSEPEIDPSLEPSKLMRFGSSGIETQILDTRLTSWGDEKETLTKTTRETVTNNFVRRSETSEMIELREVVEEVEHEISILESRVPSTTRRRRNVTISFSSPLASIINDEYGEDIECSRDMGNDENKRDNDADLDENSKIITKESERQSSYVNKTRSKNGSIRRPPLPSHRFQARPVSRIDEQEEESFSQHLETERLSRNVSLLITTPIPARRTSTHITTIPPASISRANESLYQLSPLSDFTLHQPEESFAFEVSYVAQRRDDQRKITSRSLSLSVKELIQRITDVEPYEPFWEHIKRMDLKDKNLHNLHMLSKFCGQLEELDVSNNQIAQLDGAPTTIRNLRITRNSLTDLTSWHSYYNLQYVDVSNNNITSLEGFKDLVHLRAIRADNNQIESLDGVLYLDGLISLRLRNNVIDAINFEGSSLQRLSELDLKGNNIQEVQGLNELGSLATLNLEDNQISNFVADERGIIPALKYLKLSGNNLQHMDVSQYPNLRLLYLDRNRLGKVNGLLKTKYLDSLSMREQQSGSTIDMSFIDQAFEIRKLFLSGNLLTNFTPRADFLNLQYLELANCGLEALPAEFGQIMSNIRVLNLNFNAIRDITPILGIVRLKKLHAAGNRLTRLRKTTNVLAQLRSLTIVDLRNNPLTLGFYPLTAERRLIMHGIEDDEENILAADPFTLEEADGARGGAYRERLDKETRMRRRIFEILSLGGCTRLKMLDGLTVDRAGVLARDKTWEELVNAGVILGDGETPKDEQQLSDEGLIGETSGCAAEEEIEEEVSERWAAEDSFA